MIIGDVRDRGRRGSFGRLLEGKGFRYGVGWGDGDVFRSFPSRKSLWTPSMITPVVHSFLRHLDVDDRFQRDHWHARGKSFGRVEVLRFTSGSAPMTFVFPWSPRDYIDLLSLRVSLHPRVRQSMLEGGRCLLFLPFSYRET